VHQVDFIYKIMLQ